MKKTKKLKPKHPTLKKCKARAWKAFSLYIRTRDKECVASRYYKSQCGGCLQAGHVVNKGQGYVLMFDEEDVFGQCRNHNGEHRYKPQYYISWFIDTYGKEKYDEIVERSRQIKQMKWFELLEVEEYYKYRLKRL